MHLSFVIVSDVNVEALMTVNILDNVVPWIMKWLASISGSLALHFTSVQPSTPLSLKSALSTSALSRPLWFSCILLDFSWSHKLFLILLVFTAQNSSRENIIVKPGDINCVNYSIFTLKNYCIFYLQSEIASGCTNRILQLKRKTKGSQKNRNVSVNTKCI